MPNERAPESLGSWLRQRRKALDLTQAAVAHCVGCAEVTIRKLEAEVQRPSRQIAQRLAACLEIPPNAHDLFLQVARGERPIDGLPPPHLVDTVPPPAYVAGSITRLPLDRVPPPAPLRPGSRMPLRRNPLFVGREADLLRLARALTVSETAAIGPIEIAAATGLGGIGKTQLACEFVHRYGQFFAGGVFWLSFADPAVVPAEVAGCGGVDGMQLRADFDLLPLEQQVRQVLTAWKQPLPRLLVFDNCEDEALLAQWQPRHGGCRILVTSRRHHWDATLGVQSVPLDVLLRSDSVRLLRQFRPDLPADDADLPAIATTLGDLPLALHLAGNFLAKYRHAITPAQYLMRLHTPTILDDSSLHAAGLSPTEHVQHVARTFEQSYAQLDPADPTDAQARTLLAHAASCAPGEPLPRWFLLETLELPDADVERALLAEDGLTRLINLGLLDTDAAGNLRMHRLLAAFVQAVLGDAGAQAAVETTMLRVAHALNQTYDPRPLLTVQPHLRFLTEAAQSRADANTAALCTALGVHVRRLAVYPGAQRYLEQALAIRQQVLGPNHPDTAESLNELGWALFVQGHYAAAQGYLEQALAIRQQVLGPDHPDTASGLNALGVVLWYRGHYAEAQHYLEQAVAIQERVLGVEHSDTAGSLNELGVVLQSQGQDAQAQHYLEQALEIRQRVLGNDHHHTAWSLHDLGVMFKDRGQYAQARGYLEQAVAIQERVLGTNHPDTAVSLCRLGEALQAQGHSTQAQGYLEQAVVIHERVLGTDHPHTARSLRGLGEVLHAQGDRAQARSYLEQALAIFAQRLGPQHPDTEQTRQVFAALATDPTSTERGG